jgi:ATP-binding cassette subfamily E protein 1
MERKRPRDEEASPASVHRPAPAAAFFAGARAPLAPHGQAPPTWGDILKHFRGSDLQNYFTRILEDKFKALIKPQYVDQIPKSIKGSVGPLVRSKDERGLAEALLVELQLDHVQTRDIEALSGGELQRFAIACVAVQQADVYMFDEPSSYLDVKQRLKAAQVIRALVRNEGELDDEGHRAVQELKDAKYVVCVEHDLAVLDYLSDFICVLYGTPGAYGV